MLNFSVPPVDDSLHSALLHRTDRKTKPNEALGQLEVLALQIGLIQNRSDRLILRQPTLLVFAVDHGIAAKLTPWMDDFANVVGPGGESYRVLAERTADFWQELTSRANERVALATHAGPTRALLAPILSLSLAHSFRLTIDYGSVSLVRVRNQLATIQFINR